MASSLHKLKPYAPLARHLDTDRFFRAMVDSVTDYAIFVLDPDGNVASWNPGAERMKGYTRDEIVGQHFSVFYPEKDK